MANSATAVPSLASLVDAQLQRYLESEESEETRQQRQNRATHLSQGGPSMSQMVDEAELAVTTSGRRSEALEICLGRLSTKNRELLSAYYAQGSSLNEIAISANRGLSAVKVMLMRLRRRLGECIEGQLAKGEPS